MPTCNFYILSGVNKTANVPKRDIRKMNHQKKNNMKKLGIFFVTCFALALTSCKTELRSAGPMARRTVAAVNFDKIVNATVYDVYYQQGDTFKVIVEGPEEKIKQLDIRVDGSTLTIDQHGMYSFFNAGDLSDKTKIYVTSPDILRMKQTGTGSILSTKPIDSDRLNLQLEGTGDIVLKEVICDELTAALAGTGDIRVERLTSPMAKLRLAGTGDIDVNFVHSGVVKASLAGTGDITLQGDIERLISQKAGTGDIHTDGLHTANK